MDPKALADDLVANAPSGKFGEPHVLEVQGLRDLLGAFDTDAEIAAASEAFQDRLEELTGYRAPKEWPPAPPAPQPSAIPMPPVLSPEESARATIAEAFSAPFDGSERRLDVLAERARGLLQGVIDNGFDRAVCEKMIDEAKAELRAAWDSR